MQIINVNKQKGFSLFVVAIIMLVIALLVIVTTQSSNTEMRLSTNEADHKYALSQAERGLRSAEEQIQSFVDKTDPKKNKSLTFDYDCNHNGLCAPLEQVNFLENDINKRRFNITPPNANQNEVAWKRTFNNKSIWDDNTRNQTANNNNNIRYIIEFLGEKITAEGVLGYNFRVTSRALGQNPNTVVMLQSYVELTPP